MASSYIEAGSPLDDYFRGTSISHLITLIMRQPGERKVLIVPDEVREPTEAFDGIREEPHKAEPGDTVSRPLSSYCSCANGIDSGRRSLRPRPIRLFDWGKRERLDWRHPK
jgi:hypothetical protein